jgi:hypothetical protein
MAYGASVMTSSTHFTELTMTTLHHHHHISHCQIHSSLDFWVLLLHIFLITIFLHRKQASKNNASNGGFANPNPFFPPSAKQQKLQELVS